MSKRANRYKSASVFLGGFILSILLGFGGWLSEFVQRFDFIATNINSGGASRALTWVTVVGLPVTATAFLALWGCFKLARYGKGIQASNDVLGALKEV